MFQVSHGRPLALAFVELTVVQRFHEHVHQPCVPPSLRAVLGRLSALYALWSLSRHTALLYRGEASDCGLAVLPRVRAPLLYLGSCFLHHRPPSTGLTEHGGWRCGQMRSIWGRAASGWRRETQFFFQLGFGSENASRRPPHARQPAGLCREQKPTP